MRSTNKHCGQAGSRKGTEPWSARENNNAQQAACTKEERETILFIGEDTTSTGIPVAIRRDRLGNEIFRHGSGSQRDGLHGRFAPGIFDSAADIPRASPAERQRHEFHTTGELNEKR